MSLPSPVLRVEAFGYSNKAHFGIPWVRPWDNRCKCHMDGNRIQCLSKASQHVSIFNRFPVIQPLSSKVRHLAHF